MAYTAAEAQQELLDSVAGAIDEIGFALASLGAAYEQLDATTADKLEDELFGPVQKAYGRAKRAHADFAERHALPVLTFEQPEPGLPSSRAKGFIEAAVEAIRAGDHALAEVQDDDRMLENGDGELRAGLTNVRELLGPAPHAARELVRALGR
jgi:hypothetical protein